MSGTALVLLLLPIQPAPTPLGSELVRVERVLQNEKIACDGPGLLAYLRAQIVSPQDDVLLRQLIADLGADDFDRRERASQKLVEAGRKAVPYLKAALTSEDREVHRRATLCLESLVDGPLMPLMPGVVRLLGERGPDGTVPVLVDYLGSAGDEAIEDAIFEQLRLLGLREGTLHAALVSGFGSSQALIRAAAAHVAGDLEATSPQRRLLLPLLKDSSLRVRYEAAQALARGGDASGLGILAELVDRGPIELAQMANELLTRLAGPEVRIPPLAVGGEADRKATAVAWREWAEKTAGRAGWAAPAGPVQYFGRTLVAEFDSESGEGRVSEFGPDGKRRWQLDGLKGPNDVQPLPGGRLLVAERGLDRVSEYDRAGKLLWSHKTRNSPIACQRLADGATLIVTFSDLLIVTPDGRQRLSFAHREGLRHGRMQPDGSVWVMTAQGELLEIDAKGQSVRKITPSNHGSGAGYWGCFTPLPGQRYLAALGSSGKVVEIDRTGKIEQEWNVPSPVSVVRLANGHTLVASFEGRAVLELDRAGREIGRISLRGRPFYAMRY